MVKTDLFKEHKAEYAASKKPAIVNVGSAQYLAVKGKGEPGSQEFQDAIGALYGAAWTIKMTRKFADRPDFKVCTLEGIYKDKCDWTLLIRVPNFVTQAELKKAAAELIAKGKGDAVKRVEIIKLKEGTCAQVLQVGPYDSVCQTMEEITRFEEEHQLAGAGPLHEIYLSDPRRVPAEKLKTIIRHPVRKAR